MHISPIACHFRRRAFLAGDLFAQGARAAGLAIAEGAFLDRGCRASYGFRPLFLRKPVNRRDAGPEGTASVQSYRGRTRADASVATEEADRGDVFGRARGGTLRVDVLDRNIGHEGAGTLVAAREALDHRSLAGCLHGQSQQVQNAGQLARGREPGARRQCSAQDRFPNAVFQLC